VPRPADHDERRTHIARAFQRLVAAEGIEAVSFSRVATEAGVSIGLIQHYFAGKAALLHFAYQDAVDRMTARALARAQDDPTSGEPAAAVLLDNLMELLPLDTEREVEYRVRQGLQIQAAHHAGLNEVARRSGGEILRYVSEAIESGIDHGEVAPEVDVALSARMILATVQGLGDQVALSSADEFDPRDILRQAIATVFTAQPRH
jgi:AcrR family transcriptional regulator